MLQKKHNKKIVPLAKSLRKNMTIEEKRLWYDFLRKHNLRFYRQKVIGNYIVDFYSAQARLIIELDGGGHFTDEAIEYDKKRTAFLEEYGLKVIRITNDEINKNFEGVCEYIDNIINNNFE